MSWSDWFRRRKRRGTFVEFDDQAITCRRIDGLVESVRWPDLRAALIHTGPYLDNVYWILAGDGTGCIVPADAKGIQKLLERLQALPGFDNATLARAMNCRKEEQFVCWVRTEPR